MLRFENEGTTISVKLPKTDYIVYMMANYSKETDTYHTKLYIVRKDVSDLVLIDDDYEMKSNFSSIRFDMGEYITEKYFGSSVSNSSWQSVTSSSTSGLSAL